MNNKSIMVIDYGMGNLRSVTNALDYIGADSFISSNKEDLTKADGFILPGIGAFGQAMQNLHELDMIDELQTQVMAYKKPLLGICLGMQLLFENSSEKGFWPGLGWIEGQVRLIEVDPQYRLPHVGWNDVTLTRSDPLFEGIDNNIDFFFDHSYAVACDKTFVNAEFEYGGQNIIAAVRKDNIWGTQFHPEKSQHSGLAIYQNFYKFVSNSHQHQVLVTTPHAKPEVSSDYVSSINTSYKKFCTLTSINHQYIAKNSATIFAVERAEMVKNSSGSCIKYSP